MSTNTRSEAKSGGLKSAAGFPTRTRVLLSAAAMGVGVVSIAATMVMIPAMANAIVGLGGFAAQNPIVLGLVGLFAVGQSIPLMSQSESKSGKSGAVWVRCPKCNRVFENQAQVESHSAGYHV
jgi:hypothetical protein